MEPVQATILAVVQGLTEFLPISSSAHLILASRWLGWTDQGLEFDMAVHAGSLVAIIAYLRSDLARLAVSLVPGAAAADSADRRLGLQILLATVPTAVAGFLLGDLIERHARGSLSIGLCSVLFGLLLLAADRFGGRDRDLASLTWAGVIFVGLAQMFALLPGTSRSGVVMTAALFLGLRRTTSARFSFLMGVPVMLLVAARNLQLLVTGSADEAEWLALALGFSVSALSAWLAVGWLMRWLQRQSMTVFVVYRVLLGALLVTTGLS